jgi:glyoxylase I family protein
MPTNRVTLDHVVLEVDDPVRSVEFYGGIFGLQPVRVDEYGKGQAPFPSARVNDATIVDFFPPKMWRTPTAANPNHFCLTLDREGVASVEAELARRGVPVERRDDHNYGARGFGVALYFRDPDGNTVEARYYP